MFQTEAALRLTNDFYMISETAVFFVEAAVLLFCYG